MTLIACGGGNGEKAPTPSSNAGQATVAPRGVHPAGRAWRHRRSAGHPARGCHHNAIRSADAPGTINVQLVLDGRTALDIQPAYTLVVVARIGGYDVDGDDRDELF